VPGEGGSLVRRFRYGRPGTDHRVADLDECGDYPRPLLNVWGDEDVVLVSGACPHGADQIPEMFWTR
jgi:hypothetical protein